MECSPRCACCSEVSQQVVWGCVRYSRMIFPVSRFQSRRRRVSWLDDPQSYSPDFAVTPGSALVDSRRRILAVSACRSSRSLQISGRPATLSLVGFGADAGSSISSNLARGDHALARARIMVPAICIYFIGRFPRRPDRGKPEALGSTPPYQGETSARFLVNGGKAHQRSVPLPRMRDRCHLGPVAGEAGALATLEHRAQEIEEWEIPRGVDAKWPDVPQRRRMDYGMLV